MGYVVSSASVDELQKKTPNISRFVTIAGSDYSERMLKWPSLSWNYDDIRPKNIQLDFANNDDNLGFFRNNKTLMQSEVIAGLTIRSYAREAYSLANLALTDVYSIGVVSGAYDLTGTYQVTSGGAYIIGVDNDTDNLFRLRTIVPYQINSAILVDSLDVSVMGLPRPRGIAHDDTGNNFFVLDSTNAAVHHLVASDYNINSATIVGSLTTTMALMNGVAVNSDASLMMVYDTSALRESVHTFVMSQPGSLSTASETAVYSLSVDGLAMTAMAVNRDFTRAFFVGGSPSFMRMYNMTQPGSLGNATLDPSTGDIQSLTGKNFGDGLAVARDNDNYISYFRAHTFYTLVNSQPVTQETEIGIDVSSFAFSSDVASDGLQNFFIDIYGSFVVSSGGAYLFAASGANWAGLSEDLMRFDISGNPYYLNTSVKDQSFNLSGFDNQGRGIGMTLAGDKFYYAGNQQGWIYQFTASSNFNVASLTLTDTYSPIAESISLLGGLAVNSNASWLVIADRGAKRIVEYTNATPENLNALTMVGCLSLSSVLVGDIEAISTNKTNDRIYVYDGNETIRQVMLPVAGSLVGAQISSLTLNISGTIGSGFALGYAMDSNNHLYTHEVNSNYISHMVSSVNPSNVGDGQESINGDIYNVQNLNLFKGTISEISYVNETCRVRVVDSFKQLSDRKVGTPDAPVDFTTSNYLGSDLAWWICTSYGGLSALTNSANTQIDYPAFAEWSEVFSGDQIRFNASFDGQTCTELLRKIARMSHSYIYVREGKITFKRIGIAELTVDSYGASELMDVGLSFKTADLINRQLISGAYDQNSGFQFTITAANTASVNSFGPHEDLLKDESIWYIDSATAINHAQRRIILTANPDDELSATTTARGVIRAVGETITVVDSFHGIGENYLITGVDFYLDTGRTKFELDKILIKQPFRLDVSTLDNVNEVLV